jgi:hypothetical protein
MPIHHLLMVAFDLIGSPGVEQLGDVRKDLCPLAGLRTIKNVFKIFEIGNISVIFTEVPSVELKVTLLLKDLLQETSTFDLIFPNVLSIDNCRLILFYFHY